MKAAKPGLGELAQGVPQNLNRVMLRATSAFGGFGGTIRF